MPNIPRARARSNYIHKLADTTLRIMKFKNVCSDSLWHTFERKECE